MVFFGWPIASLSGAARTSDERSSEGTPTPHRASFVESPFSGIQQVPQHAAFREKLDELYPGALDHEEASVAIKHVLRQRGFTAHGSIALVSQCRDEITKPFTTAIDHNWLGACSTQRCPCTTSV